MTDSIPTNPETLTSLDASEDSRSIPREVSIAMHVIVPGYSSIANLVRMEENDSFGEIVRTTLYGTLDTAKFVGWYALSQMF